MAYAVKKGKLYRGYYRDAEGKIRSAGSSTSKREAKQKAEEAEAKIRRGEWLDQKAGKMTFSVYFEEHWLPNQPRALTTLSTYQSHYDSSLKAAFGDMELRKINFGAVQRWVTAEEKAGTTPGTIAQKHRTLSTVLGRRTGLSAVREKLVEKNPCKGVDLPKTKSRKINVYSYPEAQALLNEIPDWYRPIPLLAAETGFRWGELMGLKVKDFSDDFTRIYLSRTMQELTKKWTEWDSPFKEKPAPKNNEDREVVIDDAAAAMVRGLVKERQLFPNDRLFSMRARTACPSAPSCGPPASRSVAPPSGWAYGFPRISDPESSGAVSMIFAGLTSPGCSARGQTSLR